MFLFSTQRLRKAERRSTELQWRCLPRNGLLIVVCFAYALNAGCSSFGPQTITRDRFDYVASISESWKRQMLHNLLKIRYADAPVFLDVTSVINSYAWEGELSLGGQSAPYGHGDSFVSLGGTGRYADKPTITYSPLIGDNFARSLMTPLPLAAILYLIQGGYPADAVLRACVNTINGLENEYGGSGNAHPGNPRFAELLEAMREAQAAGTMGLRRRSSKDADSLVMFFPASPEAIQGPTSKIQELLNLNPQVREFNVVYGSAPADNTEIAILCRSMLQVLIDFSSYIDVPALDVADGCVLVPIRTAEQERMFPPVLRVRNGTMAPSRAFVAVRYRDRWFWIEDRDVKSKTAFTFLMMMFSLTETGVQQGGAPIVTLPAR